MMAILCAIMHLSPTTETLTNFEILDTFLLYIIIFNIGLSGFMTFCVHTLMAQEKALSLGWGTGTAF
jgi:hypothetical protein